MNIELAHPFKIRYDNNKEDNSNLTELANCKTLDEFCFKLEKQSLVYSKITKDQNLYKGDGFEYFCEFLCKFYDGDNRIGISNYTITEKNAPGVDATGIGINLNPATIQCKFRGNHFNYELDIKKDDLEYLVPESQNIYGVKTDDINNILIITTAKGINYNSILHFYGKVRCIGYGTDDKSELRGLVDNNELFWKTFKESSKKDVIIKISNEKIPRPDQEEGIKSILESKIGGIFIAPTGYGKTLVMGYSIRRDIIENKNNPSVYVILTPRILLTNQDFEDIIPIILFGKIEAEYLVVHSGNEDTDFISWKEMTWRNIETTTDPKVIKEFYNKAQQQNIPLIIFGTYHSAFRIMEANIPIKYTFCDEAADLVPSTEIENDFSKIASSEFKSEKKIHLTATPKFTRGGLGINGLGMNNINKFGPSIYEQTPLTAINNGTILPPRMHLVDDNTDNNTITEVDKDVNCIIDTFFKHAKIIETLSPKILVITKGSEHLNNAVMHPKIKELIESRPKLRVFDISSAYKPRINGNEVSGNYFLRELRNLKDDDEAIIFHIRIIGKGIDAPAITGVMFLNNLRLGDFLQNMGRGMRLYETDRSESVLFRENWIKPYSWVIIPIYDALGSEMKENFVEIIRELRDYGFKSIEDIFINTSKGEIVFEQLKNLNELDKKELVSKLPYIYDVEHIIETEDEANIIYYIEKFKGDWILNNISDEKTNMTIISLSNKDINKIKLMIEEGKKAKEEKKYKYSLEYFLTIKLAKITSNMPSFLYIDNNTKDLDSLLNTNKIDEFETIIGISIENFKNLLEIWPENKNRINNSIIAFYNKRVNTPSILEYLKQQKELLKHLNPFSNQEIMTPTNVVELILDELPEIVWDGNHTFCDPCVKSGIFLLESCIKLMILLENKYPNEEERYKYIINNLLFGYTLNNRAKLLVESCFGVGELKNIEIRELEDISDIPIFDVVIGNPPYKLGLHEKFLDKAIDISKQYIGFIQPATWILNEKIIDRPPLEIMLKEKISKYSFKLKLYNGVVLFPDINITTYAGISIIDKTTNPKILIENKITNESFEYDDINKVSKYGNSKSYESLKEKILRFSIKDNLRSHYRSYRDKTKDDNYYITLGTLRGNINKKETFNIFKDDFYTFLPKNKNIKPIPTNGEEIDENRFSFKTEIETDNFINYLKTNFARFALSISKLTISLYTGELATVPWLDFNESWDDEKLYKYFELTQDEIEFIEKNIPKYY